MPRLPLDNLCAELEAPMPSAAGGSAAAACAAMAASLVVMVGQGSPDWPEAGAAGAAAEELRDQLLVLGGDDVEAVSALLAAIGDKGAGADAELQEARLRAAAVPLAIAESAAEVAMLAREAAKRGRPSMRPDAAAAGSLAVTAARVARSIVGLNLAAFPKGEEPPEVERMRAAARAVSERIGGS
jgi:methenyltetrahydrofolate cyclohydrolase